jgi:hypothetical protein
MLKSYEWNGKAMSRSSAFSSFMWCGGYYGDSGSDSLIISPLLDGFLLGEVGSELFSICKMLT